LIRRKSNKVEDRDVDKVMTDPYCYHKLWKGKCVEGKKVGGDGVGDSGNE
jgi:hypothetical protein